MKLKSILIIIATLLIGFVLGFLTNGQLTKQRIEKFVHRGPYEGFKMRVLDIIHPDQLQLEEIEPILDKYAKKMQETVAQSKYSMKTLHDDMMEELEPYLNDYQIQKLERVHRKFERIWRSHRRSPHHRPHGPPGK